MREASDEALLAGYATGDEAACAEFVRRFQSRVYGLTMMITRHRNDAEEAAQDAFVRAWRYAAAYDPRKGSVTGWLLGIARNVAIDRARMSGWRPEELLAELPASLPADSVAIDEIVSDRDEVARIVASMSILSPEQRQALLGATLLGLTAREMSQAWGLPLGTVKTRIRLALRRLRAELDRGKV